MWYLFIFLIGLAFGSFANVYFYRFPRQLSFLHPNSFCPNCNHPIPWYYNIPLFSYFYLKGKCGFCQNPISLQYPLVEILSGFLFLILSLYFSSETMLFLPAILFFSFLLFLAAGIDLITYFDSGKEYGIIPNHLVWIIAISGIFFALFNPLLKSLFEFPFLIQLPALFPLHTPSPDMGRDPPLFIEGNEGLSKILLSLLGAGTGFFFMFLSRQIGTIFFKKEALGLGDVKLVSAIGFWIGWQGVFLTLIFGSLIGTILSLILILTKKLERKSSIPFAPFLSLGAFLALFFL